VPSYFPPTLLTSPESLRPEFRLLLACGQAAIPTEKRTDQIDLPFGIRWPEFVGQARRHGLTPLAYRFLMTRADFSPAIQRLLHRDTIDIVAENLKQIAGLRVVAAAFARSGIPWLCVKGPVAATILYDDPNLRPFSDIDLLIRQPDFRSALTNLVERGFRPVFNMTPEWQALYFRDQSETTLFDKGIRLDLHWELLPNRYSFAPAMNAIWARAERANVFDVAVDTPGPHDTFVFLCLHAARHDWERLIWLIDIAALITRSDRLDWDAVVRELDHTSRKTPLQVSLMLVQVLFGVHLPLKVSARVNGDSIALALSKERIRRWQHESETSKYPWPWKSMYYRSMNLPADRRRYLHDVLLRPTPHEWRAVPLPFTCRGAYYAVRPFRLMWKHWVRRSATPQNV
jgi:Uncharacterised nucleotidyltransferase